MRHGSSNHTAGASGGVRLHSLQEDADRRERDVMNLKMEVAHLRERLHMRVGGETNAIELEDENFTLKRSLLETQQALVAHQDALREMDAKYAKAMLNLVKLDQAWKASAADLARAQQDVADAKADAFRRQQERDTLEQDHAAETEAMNARLSDMSHQLSQQDQQIQDQRAQIDTLRLENKQLHGHMDALKQKATSGAQGVASKQELDELQRECQQAKEQCATLRGETNALRDENGALKTQLEDANATIAASTSRILQLKEEHATTQVHLKSAKKSIEDRERETTHLKQEITRIQAELGKRDDLLVQLEMERSRQEQALAKQKKLVEQAQHVGVQDAQKVAARKEREWKAREAELEQKMREQEHETRCVQERLDQLQLQQNDVLLLFAGPGEDAELFVATHDLTTCVKEEIQRARATATALEKAKQRIEKLEKDVVRQDKLAQENEALRNEYDKAKKAMERMALRKSKALDMTRTPTKQRDVTRTPTKQRDLVRTPTKWDREPRPEDSKVGLWNTAAAITATTATTAEPLRTKRKLDHGDESSSKSSSSNGSILNSKSAAIAAALGSRLAAATGSSTATSTAVTSNPPAPTAGATDEDDARKARIKRVFVASRYMNTSRRMDF